MRKILVTTAAAAIAAIASGAQAATTTTTFQVSRDRVLKACSVSAAALALR